MAQETQKQPRNIFEQIALGLEVTNLNTVAISQDLANLYKMVEDIHSVLFMGQTQTAPTALGAVKDEEREPQTPQ